MMTDHGEQRFVDDDQQQLFVEHMNDNDDNNDFNNHDHGITSFTEEFAFVIELFIQILLIYCLCYLSTMKKFLIDQIIIVQPNIQRQLTINWPTIGGGHSSVYFRSSSLFFLFL